MLVTPDFLVHVGRDGAGVCRGDAQQAGRVVAQAQSSGHHQPTGDQYQQQ